MSGAAAEIGVSLHGVVPTILGKWQCHTGTCYWWPPSCSRSGTSVLPMHRIVRKDSLPGWLPCRSWLLTYGRASYLFSPSSLWSACSSSSRCVSTSSSTRRHGVRMMSTQRRLEPCPRQFHPRNRTRRTVSRIARGVDASITTARKMDCLAPVTHAHAGILPPGCRSSSSLPDRECGKLDDQGQSMSFACRCRSLIRVCQPFVRVATSLLDAHCPWGAGPDAHRVG